ncbi:MAG: DUF1926 domain-containing protein, partial [Deltaproteobacteria bacterium]|nr:DUF1926 domain-containing protein [Deltaproteobacteria bacterium]
GLLKDRTGAECEILDYDSDFAEEIILSGGKIGALIKPSSGGNILELDYKPLGFNLTNVMTRREESYHKGLNPAKTPDQQDSGGKVKTIHELHVSKEEGLGKFLVYDRYPRNSFITRLLHPETGIEAFEGQTYEEYGSFSRGRYNYQKECSSRDGGNCGIILARAGNIAPDGRRNHAELVKTITLRGGGDVLSLSAALESKEPLNFDFLFAVEFNFTLLAGNDPSRFYRIKGLDLTAEDKMMNSRGVFGSVDHVIFEDHWQFLRVTLRADEPLDFWRYPIETVSMSEGGSERTYQGFCLTAVKRIRAGNGTRHVLNLSLIFDNFGAEK